MILHGMSDVAGQGSYSVKGLREIGEKAKMVVWRKNNFGYAYDLSLDIGRNKLLYPIYAFKMIGYGIYAMFRYNVFHFHFGYSLFPYSFDLIFLKMLKKKFVMEFHGSDIRWMFYKVLPKYFYTNELPTFNSKTVKSVKRIFKHTDTIILHDNELRKHIVCENKKILIVPLRINIDSFHPIYPCIDNKVPIIVHAPSNSMIKGSEYIIEAIELLRKKHNFKFIMVEGMTQEEAFKIYEKADLIIDQLFIGTYGVFAIEAMALGKPVISYISTDMLHEFPSELPIVNANIDTIKEKIELLLENAELRNQLGIEGRKYVEDYHNYKVIARVQKRIYEGKYNITKQLDAFKYVKELKREYET